jgi:hypothetical protein
MANEKYLIESLGEAEDDSLQSSRRQFIKRVLQTGAYTAPIILSVTVATGASAASSPSPTVSVIPSSGPASSTFRFTGAGFLPNSTLTLQVRESPLRIDVIVPIPADANGNIGGIINPNFRFVPGILTVSILTSRMGNVLASVQFTVTS